MAVGAFIPGSMGDPGTAYAGLPRSYGLPTNFGYGPQIPGGDVFNRALAGMVGQLGQDVSGFTGTPMADTAAGTYSGGEDELMQMLKSRGLGQNPAMEQLLRGNYQTAMMGIPGQAQMAQTRSQQGKLQQLGQFPEQVAGNLAGEQGAHLGLRSAQDAESRQYYEDIGALIGDVGQLAFPGPMGLARSLGSTFGGFGGAPAGSSPFENVLSGGSRAYNMFAPSGSPVSTMGAGGGGVPSWLAPYTAGATLV